MKSIATAAVSIAMFGAALNPHLPAFLTHQSSTAHGSHHQSQKQADSKATDTKAQASLASAVVAAPAPVIITVQTGDSLTSIAEANTTTVQRLYDANSTITDPNVINPGEQLRVPAADETLADRPMPQPVVAAATTSYLAATTASAAVSYPAVSSNAAKAFIYSHESGNNPNATNPNGCYGLGQDCNGRVRAQCGADYACQDAYFTNYAISRYGSWSGALAFWQSHGWW